MIVNTRGSMILKSHKARVDLVNAVAERYQGLRVIIVFKTEH